MDWLNGNPSAVAFLRVSSHRQRDNTSHETQEQEVLLYCAENRLQLLRCVRMVESAKDSANRKQYIEGLQWALKNKARHILFYIFDRETRNLTDNEKNEGLVRSGKIVLHYVKERRIFHAETSDSDFFLRDVQAVTNKQFLRQLSTKVIDAQITKALSGWYPGNHPPLGYINQRLRDSEGREMKRGTIIVPSPNERVVKLVQREFELRAEGYSAQQIREKVIQERLINGLKIPTYHRSAIERRIRDPFYFGEFEWGGQRYQGKHELIVPRDILDAVAKTVGFKGAYQRRPEGEHGMLGGGWLRCADAACNCNIVYEKKVKQLKLSGQIKVYHYYHCTNGRKIHPTMKGMVVHESALWDQLGAAVDAITITEKIAEKIAAALGETHDQVAAARRREIKNYRDGLAALEFEEDAAYENLRKGLLDEAMYQRQITNLRSERRRFTELLESANSALDGAYLKTANFILELAKNAKSIWIERSPVERMEFLKMILSNQQLDGATVRYELRKPFSTLAKLRVENDWRPLLDTFRTELAAFAA